MVPRQVTSITCGARSRTEEGALLWFLTVKVNYMNALIPVSKLVNHESNQSGYENNMQKSQNMAVYAVYG